MRERTGGRSPGRWTACLGGPRTPGRAARKRSPAAVGAAGGESGTGCGGVIPGGSGGSVPWPGGGRCCVRGCSATAQGGGPVAGPVRWAPAAVTAPPRRGTSRVSRSPGARPAGWVRTVRSVRGERWVGAAAGRIPAGPWAVGAAPADKRTGSPAPAAAGAPPATARTARSSAPMYRRAVDVRPPCAGVFGLSLPEGAFPGGGPGRGVTRIGREGPGIRPGRGGARS